MLQSIGEHAKGQGLRRGECGFPRRAVDHDPGEIGDIRDPATINFSVQLDPQAHEAEDTTRRETNCAPRLTPVRIAWYRANQSANQIAWGKRPMRNGRFFPLFRVCALFLGLSFAVAGCEKAKSLMGEGPADLAKRRVDFILKTLQQKVPSTGREMQTAICRWDRDVIVMDRDAIGLAMDHFDQWRLDGKFYDGLDSYEIAPDARVGGAQDPPETIYLQVKTNGTWRWLRVPKGARISWVK